MKAWGLLLLLPFLLIQTATSVAPAITCQTQCGNITIPYPFGVGPPSCFRPGFNLICNHSLPSSPKLFLGNGTMEVTDILLAEGRVRIRNTMASMYCGNSSEEFGASKLVTWSVLRPYTFSETRNTITAIGCGTVALVTNPEGTGSPYASLCAAACPREHSLIHDRSCTGIGCCQTSIAKGMRSYGINMIGALNLTSSSTFNGVGSCVKAFLVDSEAFSFSQAYLSEDFYLANSTVPVILDWAISEGTSTSCHTARNNLSSFACQSQNSYCYDVTNGEGYRCNCSHGFEGNPYIFNGCKGTTFFPYY